MTEEDVTHVTRNKRRRRRTIPPEVKLLIDFGSGIAMLYYVTHPECLDTIRDFARAQITRLAHRVSVWNAQQEIRSLPEVDE